MSSQSGQIKLYQLYKIMHQHNKPLSLAGISHGMQCYTTESIPADHVRPMKMLRPITQPHDDDPTTARCRKRVMIVERFILSR